MMGAVLFSSLPENVSGQCTACGGSATGTGALGVSGDANGINAVAVGTNSISSNDDAVSVGEATSSGEGAYSFGQKVFAKGDNSFAIGHRAEANVSQSFNYVFGKGLVDNNLLNSISNSIMFGMNSDVSTMFIEDAGGSSGGIGRVGIGTTDPDGLLHLLEESAASATDLILEKYANTHARIRFFTGNTENGQILMDDVEDLRLINSTTDRNIRIYVNDGGSSTEAIRVEGSSANVGIGSVSPNGRLHVYSSGANTDLVLEKDATTRARLRFRESGAFIGSLELTDQEDWLLQNLVSDRHMLFSINDGGTQTTAMYIEGNSGEVGINTSNPQGRLHVNGTVFVNSIPAGSIITDSDLGFNSSGQLVDLTASSIEFKEGIEDIEFDREAFLNLRPVDFQWKSYHGGQMDVGFIAQEVAETFPALATSGYKRTYLENGDMLRDSVGIPVVDSTQTEVRGVRYHKLPVYLLALAKGQQEELNELRSQLQELTDRLDGCCTSVEPMNRLSGEVNHETLMEEKMDEFILLRNDPNPFNDYTDIQYDYEDCASCEIVIVGMAGRIVKRIKVSDSRGMVRIYSSELGSGMFVYSLVKDGNVVRSETMVSSKQ